MDTNQKRRRSVSTDTWKKVKGAFLVGGELRAIARTAGLNENTVLARAAREGWTKQRREAQGLKQRARGEALAVEEQVSAQSVAIMRDALLERHLANMLTVAGRLSDHAFGLSPEAAFTNVRQIDVADRLTRRQLGLDNGEAAVSLNFLSGMGGGDVFRAVGCSEAAESL